jgi:hypothetical protein
MSWESLPDSYANNDLLHEQLGVLRTSRERVFSSANAYAEFPASQHLRRLNVARYIAVVDFSGSVINILASEEDKTDKITATIGLVDLEDRLRVDRFNELIGTEIFSPALPGVTIDEEVLEEIDDSDIDWQSYAGDIIKMHSGYLQYDLTTLDRLIKNHFRKLH